MGLEVLKNIEICFYDYFVCGCKYHSYRSIVNMKLE